MKVNSMLTGVIAGILAPFVVFLIYYKINYDFMTFKRFFQNFEAILTPLLSLCVIGNLAIFYLFINKNYLLAARGTILSTIIYAIIIFTLKLTAE